MARTARRCCCLFELDVSSQSHSQRQACSSTRQNKQAASSFTPDPGPSARGQRIHILTAAEDAEALWALHILPMMSYAVDDRSFVLCTTLGCESVYHGQDADILNEMHLLKKDNKPASY